MVSVPRIVIGAPASGNGKTTVATGLLAAFTERGVRAAGFKVGPDYIDPSYHALACGRPGRNLDPVLVGEDLIAPLFAHGSAGADIAVIEGVMGLYDGRFAHSDYGSTAHVAALLDAPVILVVDASAQARSVAALVHGFRTFGDVRIAGVILNQVGSDRHAQMLREACEEVGTPVIGVLRRQAAVDVPSRHLGLVPAAERHDAAAEAVRAMAAMVAAGVDLDAVRSIAAGAPALAARPWSAQDAVAGIEMPARPVIAVAGGAAFTFGYTEQAELLRAAGAEVVTVDPLRDEVLPEGTSALVVGGGFPEIHAEQLAANAPLRDAVRALHRAGGPIIAECAGLLWLARSLDGRQMCGIVDADATMTGRLTLGYRDAVAVSENVLAKAGERVTGHEFHRTATSPRAGRSAAWAWSGTAAEGFVGNGLHASYLHLHWAGQPRFATRLVRAAARSSADGVSLS